LVCNRFAIWPIFTGNTAVILSDVSSIGIAAIAGVSNRFSITPAARAVGSMNAGSKNLLDLDFRR
jgi:hypothetical protein